MLKRRLREMEKVQVNDNEQESSESTEDEKKIAEQDEQDEQDEQNGIKDGNGEPNRRQSTVFASLKMACYGDLVIAYTLDVYYIDQYYQSYTELCI
jgi:hypothetical protein